MATGRRFTALAAALLVTASACSADSGDDSSPVDNLKDAAGSVTSAIVSVATQAPSPTISVPRSVGGASSADGLKQNRADRSSGQYIDWSEYSASTERFDDSDVVLFFSAQWCPQCRKADKSLSEQGVPSGLTVVSVDYDSNVELRQKYGIVVQHTFVQVDKDGNAIEKWSGSTSGEDIADHIA